MAHQFYSSYQSKEFPLPQDKQPNMFFVIWITNRYNRTWYIDQTPVMHKLLMPGDARETILCSKQENIIFFLTPIN